jgi:drug/metabolite transporter (DMT)-like permease
MLPQPAVPPSSGRPAGPGRLGRWARSRRVRAIATYPFRLGPTAPLGQRVTATPFGGLAVVNNLSGIGDALVTVALAGSVFVSVSLHAARGRTALGLLCTVLPFAVVGPFVGPLIDRVRGGRRFIVFLAAIGRMAACLMMAAWIHNLLLFPAAFLSLVCSKTHAVAKASLVPTVVEREQDLVRANSRLAVGSSIVTAIAAGVAALLYKLFGSKLVLDLDVVVFTVTAALSLQLLTPPPAVPAPEPGRRAGEGAVATEAAAGGSGFAGQVGAEHQPAATEGRSRRRAEPPPRDVALAQVAMTGMRAMAGFMTALVVFAFRRQGAPVIWYGLVAVASVGGNLSGAALAPLLRAHIREKRLVAGAAIVIGATAVAMTQFPDLHRRPAALVLAATVGLGASVAKTAFDAIVQRETPDGTRARLFARFETVFQLGWVLAALVPTLIDTSLLTGFIIVALVVLATSAVFLTGVARHPGPLGWPKPAPDPAPAPAD